VPPAVTNPSLAPPSAVERYRALEPHLIDELHAPQMMLWSRWRLLHDEIGIARLNG
jgi:hypothetical protein